MQQLLLSVTHTENMHMNTHSFVHMNALRWTCCHTGKYFPGCKAGAVSRRIGWGNSESRCGRCS